jgi:hypothetical protein
LIEEAKTIIKPKLMDLVAPGKQIAFEWVHNGRNHFFYLDAQELTFKKLYDTVTTLEPGFDGLLYIGSFSIL